MQFRRPEVEPLRSSDPGGGPVRLAAGEAPLGCVHCGGLIREGEWYVPAGRCAMGGVVTGSHVALYGDTLEPAAEHLRCAAAARGAVFPEPEEGGGRSTIPDAG
jgi:hypothetical protein